MINQIHGGELGTQQPSTRQHALSIDVEEWYDDGAEHLTGTVESRVRANTARLLEVLATHQARGTFFFLGTTAQRWPQLVREVAAAGHEIGSHGYRHRRVMDLTRRELREDVSRSLRIIEDACGGPVAGYRAPYFSIKADVHWPIDILAEVGLRYDSSILAIDRPPGLELVCPRRPFRHHNGLWEVPVAVLRLLHFWNLPIASGSGLRLLPRFLFEQAVRDFERDVGSGVFYLHPWELDADAPTAPGFGKWLIRARRQHLPQRLGELLRQRSFVPISEAFEELAAVPAKGRGEPASAGLAFLSPGLRAPGGDGSTT